MPDASLLLIRQFRNEPGEVIQHPGIGRRHPARRLQSLRDVERLNEIQARKFLRVGCHRDLNEAVVIFLFL